jgi:hypothetical protein
MGEEMLVEQKNNSINKEYQNASINVSANNKAEDQHSTFSGYMRPSSQSISSRCGFPMQHSAGAVYLTVVRIQPCGCQTCQTASTSVNIPA